MAAKAGGNHEIYITDVIHDVVWFILSVILAFGWLLVMLFIISFVTLSYIHFEIKWMVAVSAVFAVIVCITPDST